MSEIDKTNIDAQYWADEFCKRSPETDNDFLMTYFANYRFAISDPLNAEIDRLKAKYEMTAEEKLARIQKQRRKASKKYREKHK